MRRLAEKHGAAIAIIALLVLNVVLIVPLLTGRTAVPDVADADRSPAVTDSPTTPTRPTPGDEMSPTPELVSGKPRRLLAANSDQVAWRAEPSGCNEESNVEVSTDGGKTWQRTDLGLRSVVRLRAFGDASVFAIGADANCEPIYAVGAYPGSEWQSDDSMLADTWFRLPGDLDTVHDPQDRTSKPCEAEGLVDFAGSGEDEATALCSDGSLRVRDGGEDWHTAVENSDAVALNADDDRFVMAVRGSECDGLAMQRFTVDGDNLKTKKKARCLNVSDSAAPTAVSNRGGSTWVWSGDIIRSEP